MKRALSLLPYFLFLTLIVNAQSDQIKEFIPEGYVLFDTIKGDLNYDGVDDCVLIIKATDTANIVINRFDEKVDRNRRGIIVLFQTKEGFEVVDKNYDCFSSENEDGGIYFPPDLSVEIKNQKLYIKYGHGRYGHWKYTLRYQDDGFKLIGFDSSSNRGPVTMTETSINFLTKKKLVKNIIDENADVGEEKYKENWHDIEIDKLIELADIDDFDTLEMYGY